VASGIVGMPDENGAKADALRGGSHQAARCRTIRFQGPLIDGRFSRNQKRTGPAGSVQDHQIDGPLERLRMVP